MEYPIEIDGVSKEFKYGNQSSTLKAKFISLRNDRLNDDKYQHVLKNVSFRVKKGEFFGVVGRNGSGKSTLMKIIAGIYQPTSGKVNVTGRLVPFIELGVGFNPDLSGKDNVFLNGALLGFTHKEIQKMYNKIVEFAELEKYMDKKLKNYSSGMQVRLAFAMAIQTDADILLVDEVLAVGDADFQRKCFDYFRKLKKMRKTVIFISHDMDAVREYCHRAILIEGGEVIKEGTSSEVSQEYKKMFAEEHIQDVKDSEPELKRWGNGKVVYEKITAKTNDSTNSGNNISISANFIAKEHVEKLVIGFSITDSTGMNLFGTNTLIKGLKLLSLKKNEKQNVVWEMPNILSDGSYFVNIAIVDSSGTITYDWWDEAACFKIRTVEKTPYPINPNISVRINDK